MSRKRPFFESQTEWTENLSFYGKEGHRVRVVDARELTPEKAVEKVLQGMANNDVGDAVLKSVGMAATYTDGIVRVRKIKESNR